MTDKTGVDVVKVNVNVEGITRDFWYASCTKCGWKGELVIYEQSAKRDKVDHIYSRCLATSTGEVPAT